MGTVHTILTHNLRIPRICVKLVLKIFNDDGKEMQKNVAQEMVDKNEKLFELFVQSGNWRWVMNLVVDPQSEIESSQWKIVIYKIFSRGLELYG